MNTFLKDDYLLSNDIAKRLYQETAKLTPIVDYHCHINPEEIAKDRQYDNITQVWLGGDHYKWRLMRACGIPEDYITGNASDHDKFIKWAQALQKGIGNPLYLWSHMELKKYFGYDGVLNEDTAEDVWTLCNEKLATKELSVRGIINQSNVTHLCTTDDPIDALNWHEAIAADTTFHVKVLPTWRPDKAMNIEKDTYLDYIALLSEAASLPIRSFTELKEALANRMDFFADHGCLISDHALEYVMYAPVTEEEIEAIFAKRLANVPLSCHEILQYKTAFMLFVAKEYTKRNWAMQLHYGCKRNNNDLMFDHLGPDTGYDCVDNYTPSAPLADFLNALEKTEQLPKTILYSLNPNDNAAIDTVIGCFQNSTACSKLQHGAAWWFNDHKKGILDHLTTMASIGCLGTFVGMLTDSRSFLSYTRHDYFRRILCEQLSLFVLTGEYPEDYKRLNQLVADISYYNAIQYFNFK